MPTWHYFILGLFHHITSTVYLFFLYKEYFELHKIIILSKDNSFIKKNVFSNQIFISLLDRLINFNVEKSL